MAYSWRGGVLPDRHCRPVLCLLAHRDGLCQRICTAVGLAAWVGIRLYNGVLLPLHKTSVRNYPQQFEHNDLDAPIPMVTHGEVSAIAKSFAALRQHGSNKRLSIAVRRLNRRALRTSPEDGVLDLTIALESLLTDGNRRDDAQSCTACRGALQAHEPTRCIAVFREIKEVYKHRSAIVHGDSVDAYKSVSTRNVSIEDAAVEHLRAILSVMLERPEFLDPATIDQKLLAYE